jgi:hypothetical protein
VAGEKSLRRSGRSEALQLAFPSSYWDVRTFHPVVQPLATTVEVGKVKVAKCGIVGAVSVSDDRSGHNPLVLQQLAHQA